MVATINNYPTPISLSASIKKRDSVMVPEYGKVVIGKTFSIGDEYGYLIVGLFAGVIIGGAVAYMLHNKIKPGKKLTETPIKL